MDQIGEGLARNARGARTVPRSATNTGCVARPWYMASSSPRHQVEQAQAFGAVADLVAQIVGPAAIGVDVVEILVQALGQQEADHVEIFVVVGGQPARVGFGFGGGVSLAERFGRPDELGRGAGDMARPAPYGMIAVFKWPLWLIRWRITSSRLASGSSLLTKNEAVMCPAHTRSSALRM